MFTQEAGHEVHAILHRKLSMVETHLIEMVFNFKSTLVIFEINFVSNKIHLVTIFKYVKLARHVYVFYNM